MKILITGCAGFIASNVLNTLTEIIDVNLDGQVSNTYEAWGCDNLQFGYADNVKVNNWSRCGFETLTENYLNDFDVLVHLATANIIYAMDEPVKTFKTNAFDTIELFRKFKGKIIYTSTASVYGQSLELPTKETAEIQCTNAYDTSKFIAEQYLMLRGNYTTLRLSNVYGPGQRPEHPYSGVIGKFIGSDILNIYGDGTQTRDYTYVADVVEAIHMAIMQPAKNTEINIASGVETSVNDIAAMFNRPRKYIDKRAIDGINRRWLSRVKAMYLLGWQPTTELKEGIRLTLESLQISEHGMEFE